MPGWWLFRRLNRNRVPVYAVIAVSVAATIILIPAYWGNSVGVAWAYGALTGICTVGLYIAYILPVYLRGRLDHRIHPGVRSGLACGRQLRARSNEPRSSLQVDQSPAECLRAAGGA